MSTSATTGGHDGDGPAGAVDPLLDPAFDPDLDAELDAAARGTTEVVAPARRRALGLALAVISTGRMRVCPAASAADRAS
jgi:hypothetical protein